MNRISPFEVKGADGRLIRGNRAEGKDRQVLFITGFLSKRCGNKSKALSEWCLEDSWGFCCYDVRGFGDSGGRFADYTLSDWVEDARTVISMLGNAPPLTIVGNSLGGWIAWLMAQAFDHVERLILIAPAFNMMGVRAAAISDERRREWRERGTMPWDDDPAHKDWPLSWKWVDESEAYWRTTFDRLRPVKTTIVHGQQDEVILPEGSGRFVAQLLAREPSFPIELHLIVGDHRLSGTNHMKQIHRLLLDQS